MLFVYYIILPNSIPFLLNFGGNVATPVISVTAYMSLALTLMFWMMVFFETPLLMFGATKLGIIPYRRFKSVHKYVPWVAGALGAFITPGFDLANALMVAAPLTVLYHIGLFASWAARPEEGNYLFIRSLWHAIMWVPRRPVVAYRWTVRMMRKHGLIWQVM